MVMRSNSEGDMATSKKAQSKAGVPGRRRGQQMGDERSQKDKTPEAKEQTPAARGRSKSASNFFADGSSQVSGTCCEALRDESSSLTASDATGNKLGETRVVR